MILTVFSERVRRMKLKIHKTEITISYTLICLAAICVVLNLFAGFMMCMIAVAVHEMGHLAAMGLFGIFPDKIKISLFEITITDRRRLTNTTMQNIVIIFSGPFANFICFILFYLLYLLCNFMFLEFAFISLFTGLFNMLPVLSLDGGQLLYILMLRRTDEDKSRRIVNIITFLCIFPLSTLGFVMMFQPQHNFSLLVVSLYLVLALIFKKDTF